MQKLVLRFKKYISIHKDIENNVIEKINNSYKDVNCICTNEPDYLSYFSKNYLSILFLWIYEHIGLAKKEIIFYGILKAHIKLLIIT